MVKNMYFRIALQTHQPPIWTWRSTPLSSLDGLRQTLKIYKDIPKHHVRIFFSTSLEFMDDMLTRQNQGLPSSSITAEEFLRGKQPGTLELARLELELSGAGDHDCPYTFSPPASLQEYQIWTRLMNRVRSGELEP
jgi:hypothetical protein